MTVPSQGPARGVADIAAALTRHAEALARARAAARRAGDRKWSSARVLWPRFTGES